MREKSKYAAKKAIHHPATEKSKTAQFANPRNARLTKAEYELKRRIDDFMRGPQAANRDRQVSRWDGGGFHRPGSLQR